MGVMVTTSTEKLQAMPKAQTAAITQP